MIFYFNRWPDEGQGPRSPAAPELFAGGKKLLQVFHKNLSNNNIK
jgi:hypothetical protein